MTLKGLDSNNNTVGLQDHTLVAEEAKGMLTLFQSHADTSCV